MLSVSAREKENHAKREKATIALGAVENATERTGPKPQSRADQTQDEWPILSFARLVNGVNRGAQASDAGKTAQPCRLDRWIWDDRDKASASFLERSPRTASGRGCRFPRRNLRHILSVSAHDLLVTTVASSATRLSYT